MLMNILLLSAYDAASHRAWREGLVRYVKEHRWTVLTLPPRFFAWRSRGNALTWAFEQRDLLARKFDLVLATSMTDLAELKGIVQPLAASPSVIYFHENQFAYPEQRERKEYQNYKLTNIYTALAADRVLFNSKYNLDTFLEGTRGLLSVMPDHVPTGVAEVIRSRAEVLPVPLEASCYTEGPGTREGPLSLVWNHRWEHDKAPERFFKALYRLREKGVDFKVHVLGQQFRDQPADFDHARERLQDNILNLGFVEDASKYRALLADGDVIISTALHDFQGLAVLEGVAAGCVPLVPDRLAYSEFIPGKYRYDSIPDDEDREVEILAQRLEKLCRDPERTRKMKPPDLKYLSWESLGPRYREIINSVL